MKHILRWYGAVIGSCLTTVLVCIFLQHNYAQSSIVLSDYIFKACFTYRDVQITMTEQYAVVLPEMVFLFLISAYTVDTIKSSLHRLIRSQNMMRFVIQTATHVILLAVTYAIADTAVACMMQALRDGQILYGVTPTVWIELIVLRTLWLTMCSSMVAMITLGIGPIGGFVVTIIICIGGQLATYSMGSMFSDGLIQLVPWTHGNMSWHQTFSDLVTIFSNSESYRIFDMSIWTSILYCTCLSLLAWFMNYHVMRWKDLA